MDNKLLLINKEISLKGRKDDTADSRSRKNESRREGGKKLKHVSLRKPIISETYFVFYPIVRTDALQYYPVFNVTIVVKKERVSKLGFME